MWSSTLVDELGYLAYDARAADLLFQLVSRRYEHRSLLITTNLPFKHWDTVFPNASCADDADTRVPGTSLRRNGMSPCVAGEGARRAALGGGRCGSPGRGLRGRARPGHG